MKIGLIDYDSKTPNLAIMKLSAWHKAQGNKVILNPSGPGQADKVYCSVIFDWNKAKAAKFVERFNDVELGGSGWDLNKELPPEVEEMPPDYGLYTAEQLYPRITGCRKGPKRMAKAQELVDSGIGRTTTGCIRNCPFCIVREKEGPFRKAQEIGELVNPKSNLLTLLDANITADPDVLDKLQEIRERKLVANITQGVDARLMTDEIAYALSRIRMYGSDNQINVAWDLMHFEEPVLRGINMLKKHIKSERRVRVYMLCGYNTSWEEDLYRFNKIRELGAYPYIMIYNKVTQREQGKLDLRLFHFARWVNAPRLFKSFPFSEYDPWLAVKKQYEAGLTTVKA